MFDATTETNTKAQAVFQKIWDNSIRNSDVIGYRTARNLFSEFFTNAIEAGLFMPSAEDIMDLVKQVRQDITWNISEAIKLTQKMLPMVKMPDESEFNPKSVMLAAGVERYIHIHRSQAGTKVVRDVNNVDMGYFCKEVEIKGESTLVTLEEELPSGTKHVIKTSAELVMTFTAEHNSEIQDISGHRC